MPQEYTVKNFNRRQIRLEDMLLHRCKGMQRICYVMHGIREQCRTLVTTRHPLTNHY